ncbi:DeoR/GlpR family transcriptional regulator of sugar metabolism [Sporosarcina luteola]|nr:DeoR/GlpR family transcriptional regulator of sugar metabolism [Sporosarcina luteola]
MEHTKFGITMFSYMYPVHKLHLLITDKETTKEDIEMVTSFGVEVRIAEGVE